MRAARETVATVAPSDVLDEEQTATLGELRERYFPRDRAMAGLLVGTIVALPLATALGIVRPNRFWVSQGGREHRGGRPVGLDAGGILINSHDTIFIIFNYTTWHGELIA